MGNVYYSHGHEILKEDRKLYKENIVINEAVVEKLKVKSVM